MSVRPGQPWGSDATGAPDLEVAGDDAALAAAVAAAVAGGSDGAPPLVRFGPSPASDLARAVGLPGLGATEVPVDALRVAGGGVAVNGVVAGVAPDRLRWWHRRRPVEVEVDGRRLFSGRATTVVVLNGQYLRGRDVSPRGHPGDGVAEIQVYALPAGQRGALRARLRTGAHLPHPAVKTGRGRQVSIRPGRSWPLEVDGQERGSAASIGVEVAPGAYRLVV